MCFYDFCDLFAGRTARVDIRSDTGSSTANFTGEARDLLTPLKLSAPEFARMRKELGGTGTGFFNESVKKLTLSGIAAVAGMPLEKGNQAKESALLYINNNVRLAMVALFNCYAVDVTNCDNQEQERDSDSDAMSTSTALFSSCLPSAAGGYENVILFAVSFATPQPGATRGALDSTEVSCRAYCDDVVLRNNMIAVLRAPSK